MDDFGEFADRQVDPGDHNSTFCPLPGSWPAFWGAGCIIIPPDPFAGKFEAFPSPFLLAIHSLAIVTRSVQYAAPPDRVTAAHKKAQHKHARRELLNENHKTPINQK